MTESGPAVSRRAMLGGAAAFLAGAPLAEAADEAAADDPNVLRESARDVPVADSVDVLVCGGGPAGIAAAISAARTGASVRVLEVNGCLGGVWTAGLLSYVIDAKREGVNAELVRRLSAMEAIHNDDRKPGGDGPVPSAASEGTYVYQAEAMKVLLDDWLHELGVAVQIHTRVVDVIREGRRIVGVVTESKSGRQAWRGRVVIDSSGDGDVGALAGCDWEFGRDRDCPCQPMSLMGFVSGRPATFAEFANNGPDGKTAKRRLREAIEAAGGTVSYSQPTLWDFGGPVAAVMLNHEYGVRPFDAAAVSEATRRARRELFAVVAALRASGGKWDGLRLVATAEQIGIRDGRRIRGRYAVSVDDVVRGARHDDAVCRSSFCVDVHAPTKEANETSGYGTEGVEAKPFDIPLRALIAADVDGLMLAGRCISGDFYAHASYRVTGNAVAMGEAAGVAAAQAARDSSLPHELPWAPVAAELARQRALASI